LSNQYILSASDIETLAAVDIIRVVTLAVAAGVVSYVSRLDRYSFFISRERKLLFQLIYSSFEQIALS